MILAGSVLEALLIDWLSEIKKVNFFKHDYMVFIKDRETNQYKRDKAGNCISKKADLRDYIDAIEEIKKPDWMEEASRAQHIREKRNLVHAKLCLKMMQ